MTLRLAAAFALLVVAAVASAGTGYKCVSADGSVSFQDRPCPREASSSQFEYRDEQAAAARDTAPTSAPAQPTQAPMQNETPPSGPDVPPPEFYACTRPDGARYYSDNGVSVPYAMPLGVLGYPPLSLDSTAHLGVSAPEVSHPPILKPGSGSDIAASYVMVKDVCRRLPPEAACAALRSERDKIDRQAQRAFKEDRPPLEARRRTLDYKLAGC
jgi:hypothetical protein